MSHNSENLGQESIGQCSVCGRITELVELPGRIEQFCLACSADLATASLLITEIDAATLAGRNTNALVSECTEISSRILNPAQICRIGILIRFVSGHSVVPIVMFDLSRQSRWRRGGVTHLLKAASLYFVPFPSAIALTDTIRICPWTASRSARIFTCRPSIPLRVSGLLTIQIRLSLSAVNVLPSVPTMPVRLIGFPDILRVSEPLFCVAPPPPFCPACTIADIHVRKTATVAIAGFFIALLLGEKMGDLALRIKILLEGPVSRAW